MDISTNHPASHQIQIPSSGTKLNVEKQLRKAIEGSNHNLTTSLIKQLSRGWGPESLTTPPYFGPSILSLAVKKQSQQAIKAILDEKPPMDALRMGKNILYSALDHFNPECFHLLSNHAATAEPSLMTTTNWLPSTFHFGLKRDRYLAPPVFYAVTSGNLEGFKLLLPKLPRLVQHFFEGYSLLEHIIKSRKEEFLKIFLEEAESRNELWAVLNNENSRIPTGYGGIDILETGRTPPEIAEYHDWKPGLEILFEYKAYINLNHRDTYHNRFQDHLESRAEQLFTSQDHKNFYKNLLRV